MYELARLKPYGNSLIRRLLGFLARLNRKGYICHRMFAKGIKKDLKKRGMLK